MQPKDQPLHFLSAEDGSPLFPAANLQERKLNKARHTPMCLSGEAEN